MSFWQWAPYVPVGERRAKARKKMEKLRKQGKNIKPVEIEGRTIARTFWGKRWCEHLESFSDYSNRLPRGRTYVRNGSVCHLEIAKGEIRAMVSGANMYNVIIKIAELSTEKWKKIKAQCTGRIGSILELLKGKLSEEVMAVVSHRDKGLFPLPGEIDLSCSCPDWAEMCKHVAAVLYGVGHRLDTEPDLLFTLRGVDAKELISAPISIGEKVSTTRKDTLEDAVLADVFGINMDIGAETDSANGKKQKNVKKQPDTNSLTQSTKAKSNKFESNKIKIRTATGSKKSDKITKTTKNTGAKAEPKKIVAKQAVRKKGSKTFNPTGANIKNLRIKSGLSVTEFATRIGATVNTIYRWENTKGKCSIHSRFLTVLEDIHRA